MSKIGIKKDATTHGKHLKPHKKLTITEETRQESYVVRPATRAEEILRFLGDKEMTARQIAYGMKYTALNAVKPRLTELKAKGLIEVTGKRYDPITDRNVALWRAVK